jgi:hypothetical protein
MELKITIALIIIILLVITIDLILKKKKKSKSTDLEKYSSELNSKRLFLKPLIISLTLIIIFSTTFYLVNKSKYNYRLTDFDDEISVLDIIKLDNYHIDNVKLVGDSIYLFENNSIVNGLIYCEYGNMGILKKGKPNSKWREFYSDGQIKMEAEMKNGKQVGLRKDWYRNGQLKFKGYFKNDVQEGISKFWYSNGQIELESEFKNGFHYGNHKRWFKDGKLKSEFDKFSKTYNEFWPNGNIYCSVSNTTNPIDLINDYDDNFKTFYSSNGDIIHQNGKNKYVINEWFDYNGKKCNSGKGHINGVFSLDCNPHIYIGKYSNGQKAIYDDKLSRTYYFENGKIESYNIWDEIGRHYIKREFFTREGKLAEISHGNISYSKKDFYKIVYDEFGNQCKFYLRGDYDNVCNENYLFNNDEENSVKINNKQMFLVSKDFYFSSRQTGGMN